MSDSEAFYRTYLQAEFAARKQRNARYSLRGFARSLDVDHGYLSKLMAGKLLLSLDLAGEMVSRLKLSPVERKEFILSAAEEQKCHALYLLDPGLTDCAPTRHASNLLPLPRKKR